MRLHFLILAAFSSFTLSSQIFKGIGIFGALTSSKHEYRNTDDDKKGEPPVISHYYPQTHISKERLSWGAGIFAEFGKERIRWQTELEYINKGASEMDLINPITGDRSGVYVANKLTYIQWNNYLKFYYPIFNASHWYWMAGVRLEYKFKSVTPIFPVYSAAFPTFWFSGDLGIGYEVPITQRIGLFLEGHWNPDIIPHRHDNTKIRARTFELRLGLVLRPRKSRIDDCNAPRYKGPAY